MATDSEMGVYYRARAAEWRERAEKATPDQKLSMLKIAEGFAALAVIFEKPGKSSKD